MIELQTRPVAQPDTFSRPARPAAEIMRVSNLGVRFATKSGIVEVVRDASFTLHAGETLALVGESGSGKSTLARALNGQICPPFTPVRGEVTGRAEVLLDRGALDLVRADSATMRKVRAHDIAMISQDALSGLNPVLSIAWQMTEALRVAEPRLPKAEALARAAALLADVELPDPAGALRRFPHQFSGGQRQRIMIAMALARRPRVLIADEPTTALDATVQSQVLRLLKRLQRQHGMAVIFITHDLVVVSRIADRVAIMYAGEIVELTDVARFRRAPRHPYTAGLLASRPGYGGSYPPLTGYAPSIRALPVGCAFRSRCPRAEAACALPVASAEAGRDSLRCWRPL
ncbi:ATP-binding cassette domain-containing protein [Paracoccus sp. S-4012]|uniref:ABC transporter ATP-binding protein n=1 Tax=Paracoccus sp. S-4012 TaxID=2665648 RepID=UPI0012B0AFFB|nr:ABC transporter ATP-binding protein [Paracoccus sp. S-4012]MRX52102.1 ATP-binding cassette domain-containing protein [Paracoccus sp. S-4012]